MRSRASLTLKILGLKASSGTSPRARVGSLGKVAKKPSPARGEKMKQLFLSKQNEPQGNLLQSLESREEGKETPEKRKRTGEKNLDRGFDRFCL